VRAADRPLGGLDLTGIDWVIAGGESGPDHRPPRPGVGSGDPGQLRKRVGSVFFKQWGGRTPKAGGRELDGRVWDEMPARAGAAA